MREGGNTYLHRRLGQTFYVVGCSGHDDVDEEMYVSKANFLVREVNILVSKASKLSAGTGIFRGS